MTMRASHNRRRGPNMPPSDSNDLNPPVPADTSSVSDTRTLSRCSADDHWCDAMPELVDAIANERIELDLNAVLCRIPEVDRSDAVIDAAIRSVISATFRQGGARRGATRNDIVQTLIDRSPHLASRVRLAALLDDVLNAEFFSHPETSTHSRPDRLPFEFGPVWSRNEQRFLLVERLQGGRRSRAFRAIDRARSDGSRSHMVVVKMLPAEDRAATDWAIAEASRLARVDCEHVCRVVDAGIADGAPYLVTDFVAGAPLAQLPTLGAFPLPAARAVDLILDVCRGLEQAHSAGVRHLDIHPGNVVVAASGRGVLVDFGLGVHVLEPEDDTRDTHSCGAPGFIAPELTSGSRSEAIDLVKADVYAVGGLLLWLVTGKAPNGASVAETEAFHAALQAHPSTPGGLPPGMVGISLDDDLRRILARALAITPNDRYHAVAAFASDLSAWSRHEVIPWTDPSTLHRIKLAIRRASPARRWGVASAATIFLGLLSLLIVQQFDSIARERDAALTRAAASEAARAAAAAELNNQQIVKAQAAQIRSLGSLLRMMADQPKLTNGQQWLPVLVAIRDMSDGLGLDSQLLEQLARRRLDLFEHAERLLPSSDSEPSVEDAAFAAARGSWILETNAKDWQSRAVRSLETAQEIVQKILPPNERFRREVEYRCNVAKVIHSNGTDTAAVSACRQSQNWFDSLPAVVQKRLTDAMADGVAPGPPK